jgi:hypothetical protein
MSLEGEKTPRFGFSAASDGEPTADGLRSPPTCDTPHLHLPDVGRSGGEARGRAGRATNRAKARRANGWVDRPLLPSEQVRLVKDATRLTLTG